MKKLIAVALIGLVAGACTENTIGTIRSVEVANDTCNVTFTVGIRTTTYAERMKRDEANFDACVSLKKRDRVPVKDSDTDTSIDWTRRL